MNFLRCPLINQIWNFTVSRIDHNSLFLASKVELIVLIFIAAFNFIGCN